MRLQQQENGSQFHPRLYRPCSSRPARIRWLYITSIQVVLSLVMRTFDLRPLDVVSWDIGPTPGVTSHSSCPYSLKTPRNHIKLDKDKFPNASTMYPIATQTQAPAPTGIVHTANAWWHKTKQNNSTNSMASHMVHAPIPTHTPRRHPTLVTSTRTRWSATCQIWT